MEYKIQAVKLAKEPGGEKAASAFLPPAVAGLPKAENDIPCPENQRQYYQGKNFSLLPDASGGTAGI
ncbi:MAG: hypothetical protein HFG14_08890 [Lachnospiraceae bacterium]|jgi:hypothetical protein|nr:hypothetical protein [Lachnospiraceae bacterium]NBJ82902.1 hypothetical protein [bacterium 1XD42-76]NBK06193.1 hypothetical protein [bacterium 1XD42-94]